MLPQARNIVFAKGEITGTSTCYASSPLIKPAASAFNLLYSASDDKASPSPSPASGVKGAVRLPGSDNTLNTWIFYLILIAASAAGLSASLLGLRKKWTTHK